MFNTNNETKHKNEMQIKLFRFLRKKILFKQVLCCLKVEGYHCAIMTLR